MVKQYLSCLAAGSLLLALSAGHPAWAQKRGGILRLASPGSPANMSILESSTLFTEMPMMGVFNNLIVFDQHKPQVSLDTIVTDLATSWSWDSDGTALTFQLRQDVSGRARFGSSARWRTAEGRAVRDDAGFETVRCTKRHALDGPAIRQCTEYIPCNIWRCINHGQYSKLSTIRRRPSRKASATRRSGVRSTSLLPVAASSTKRR